MDLEGRAIVSEVGGEVERPPRIGELFQPIQEVVTPGQRRGVEGERGGEAAVPERGAQSGGGGVGLGSSGWDVRRRVSGDGQRRLSVKRIC